MIAFFARNRVAANLLMFAIIFAGAGTLLSGRIPVEVFPTSESRTVSVSVPYRGATPEEVEESIVIRIEEAIADVEGIDEMVSYARSSSGTVNIEVHDDYDVRETLEDIQVRVDAIADFPPGDAEKPTVRVADSNRWVISVVVAADLSERDLRKLGEQVQEELIGHPDISTAELGGVRPFEITIEIDEAALQRHNLSFSSVSAALRNSSIDVPAGTLETPGGDIVLRTKGRAYDQEAFEAIPLISAPDGTRVTVGDVAHVTDGFDENPFIARYNGKRAVLITVFRDENQSAIKVAKAVKTYMKSAVLPQGVEINYWSDSSEIVEKRLATLVDSFWKSMVLVFLLLTLFLRPSLAFWVTLGIPVCFLGAFATMPFLGTTINIVSLFGFILVLGVVVDDAIVTGENIFTKQKDPSLSAEEAAIEGTHEVALPVVFGVLTTMLAFVPLYFMSGGHGEWMSQIGTIVIAVLAFSLIESKLILPAHLAHRPKEPGRLLRPFFRFQQAIVTLLERFIDKFYRPALRTTLRYRYATLAAFVGIGMLIIGFIGGGTVKQVMFPRVDSERATVRLTMQEGTPFEVTERHVMRMEEIVNEMRAEFVSEETGESIIEDMITSIGGQGVSSSKARDSTGQSHKGELVFYIKAPEDRPKDQKMLRSTQLLGMFRERLGPIMGAEELYFRAELFRGREPIDVQLRGPDSDALAEAASETRDHLKTYAGLFDVTDSLDESRNEIQLKIRPEAEQFGLTMADLAQQVRQAFFGEEIQRLIRSRDEVRVMLRYPERDRKSLAALDAMRIRTGVGADAQEVPFTTVAEAVIEKSLPVIQRIDRNRSVNITSDADKENVDLDAIRLSVGEYLDGLMREYPGMSYGFEGEARDQRESKSSFIVGGLLIFFGIYSMLAIPFKSYVQPLMVIAVIPFGLVGAVGGHMLEDWLKSEGNGMPLSMLSYFGMLALSGVVVNDSLVLVDYINRKRRAGVPVFQAVNEAGGARFRAIILTSITTFAGLFPLIRMESTQAQFLIPMAVSLGYGILFATLITLFLVPMNYLILEDIKDLYGKRQPVIKPKGAAATTT